MKREQLREYYHNETVALQTRINALKAKSRNFVIGEIASFLAIIFFVVLITISDSTSLRIAEGVLAVVMFGLYVIVRNRDVKNSELTAETERLCKAYQHEEAYLNGDFSAFDDGERYVNPKHPFSYDLDIFGKDSLYQRINRTVTTGGADRLAYYLSSVDAHKSIEEINEYSEVIAELSGCDLSPSSSPSGRGDAESSIPKDNSNQRNTQTTQTELLSFISFGVDKKIDTDAVLQSLPALKNIAIPSYFGGKAIKVVAWLLAIGLIVGIVAAIYRLVNPMLPIMWLFVNFFLVQGLANKYLKEMQSVGYHLNDQMKPFMRVVRHAVDNDFPHSDHLRDAVDSFGKLTNITETLVLRGNGVYRFFADAFGLRGLFLVAKFYHWRNMASDNLPEWIDAVTEIDALVSMAQFRFNHAEGTANAIIVDGVAFPFPEKEGLGERSVVYSAKGLYHPFLGEKAVRNDFSIKNRNFYIITGANMAGKSTFLRAVGVNYVLAMNGLPVFADSLKVSRFNLFTSMRTSDDLAHGISYFNAELLRLKELIKSLPPTDLPLAPSEGGEKSEVLNTFKSNNANPNNGAASVSAFPPPSEGARERLIILDEILKGTNSLDKLNGSRMFLRAMEDKPVTGIIATHDLELSKMEQESPRFHNYCFEIELGTDVTYSYKITPGVARNQNATFLLKKLLEDDKTQ